MNVNKPKAEHLARTLAQAGVPFDAETGASLVAMTDNERIARLTELARRKYGPKALIIVREESVSVASDFGDEGTGTEQLFIRGPHCLDALEAALLVLAGEGRFVSDEQMERAANIVATAVEAHERHRDLDMDEVEHLLVELDITPEVLRSPTAWREMLRQYVARETSAWVEQLAAEWERNAAVLNAEDGLYQHGGAARLRGAARQLRERAKGGA